MQVPREFSQLFGVAFIALNTINYPKRGQTIFLLSIQDKQYAVYYSTDNKPIIIIKLLRFSSRY